MRKKKLMFVGLVVCVLLCLFFYQQLLKDLNNDMYSHDAVWNISVDTLLAGKYVIQQDIGARRGDKIIEELQPSHTPLFLQPTYNRDVLYPIKIPKIIHQIWDTFEVPRAFHEWMKSWHTINPTFQHWFWSLDDARELIRLHYPSHLTLYDSYLSPIYRADAARYFIIHHYGGFYFDLDCRALRSLEGWSEAYECLISEEPWEHTFVVREENSSNILNGFIACQPSHPFLQTTIDSLPEAASRYFGEVLKATGPHFFNSVFIKYKNMITSEPEAHIFPYIQQQQHDFNQQQQKLNNKKSKSINELNLLKNSNKEIKNSLKNNKTFLPFHHINNPSLHITPIPTLTKLPSHFFFPTYDRSESDTLVYKCSPDNFNKLNSQIAKGLCRQLIRTGFRQHKPEVSKLNNENNYFRNDQNNNKHNKDDNKHNKDNNKHNKKDNNNKDNDKYPMAYTDHDWLHSYNMADSWKLKDLAHVSDIIKNVVLASNHVAVLKKQV